MNSFVFSLFFAFLFLEAAVGRWAWTSSRCYSNSGGTPAGFSGLQHRGEIYLELNTIPVVGQTVPKSQVTYLYNSNSNMTCRRYGQYTIVKTSNVLFYSLVNGSLTKWSIRDDQTLMTIMAETQNDINAIKAVCPGLPAMVPKVPVSLTTSPLCNVTIDGLTENCINNWNTLEFVNFDMNWGAWGGICGTSVTIPTFPLSSTQTFWVNQFSNTPFPSASTSMSATATATATATPSIVLPTLAIPLPNPVGTYVYAKCTFALTIPNVGNLYYNTEIRIGAWTLPVYQTTYWYIGACTGSAFFTSVSTFQAFPYAQTTNNTWAVRFILKKNQVTANAPNAVKIGNYVCNKNPFYWPLQPVDFTTTDCPPLGITSIQSCPIRWNTVIIDYALNLVMGSPLGLCSRKGQTNIPYGAFTFSPKFPYGFYKKQKKNKKLKKQKK